ncbi:hypothetical protein B0H13DRAFT_2363036 [Mycena leptocephala]|nr:hypothetical protein B0H13DRAFT_2363036 [Mycena leptocephala]
MPSIALTASYSLLLSGAFDVGGVFASSVSISLTPDVTVVAFDFLRARFPSRLSQERQAQRLAFTINGGPHDSFTLELACSVSHVLATDVCMALDWKTGVRECLIGLGLPPSNVFDHLYALVPHDLNWLTIPVLLYPRPRARVILDLRTRCTIIISNPNLRARMIIIIMSHFNLICLFRIYFCPHPRRGAFRSVHYVSVYSDVGSDTLFLSPEPLQNVFGGNDYSLRTHLSLHGIPSQGLSAAGC